MFVVGYISRTELKAALEIAMENNQSIQTSTQCYFGMLELRPRGEGGTSAPFVDLQPWLHTSSVQVTEHTPLTRIHDMFLKLGLRYALVTRFGKLVGIITKKDILRAIRASEHH